MNCVQCGQQFTSKQSLNYHITNQVCQKHVKKCDLCNFIFSNKSALLYHINHKVCQNTTRSNGKKLTLKIKQKYEDLSKKELLIKVAQLEGKVEALTDHPQTVNNNIIIFPKEFGKEDIGYVQQKLGDILTPLIKNHTFNSIPTLFSHIHNNKLLPEYHNVYTTGERSNYVLISDGEQFKHCPKKTIIDQIIEDKRQILNDYIDKNGRQLGGKVLLKYEKYKEKIDDDPSFRRELEVEIGGLLLDMKTVIANDDKTRHLLERIDAGQYELTNDTQ